MYSYSSSTPLLCLEDSDTEGDSRAWTVDQQDEDWSSGYDSTDVSDADSDVMSTASVADVHERLSTSGGDEGVQEVMKFKSTHALSESLKLMLEMPEMCDVTFLVGPREDPVYGVRAIMGTRSRVFYQLILRHLHLDNDITGGLKKPSKKSKKSSGKNSQKTRFPPGRLTIPVRKYDFEVFRMLIQFVHCGCAAITEESVAGLLCGAVQFELSDLADACWEFINRCVFSGRDENLLSTTRFYSGHKVSEQVVDKQLLAKWYTFPTIYVPTFYHFQTTPNHADFARSGELGNRYTVPGSPRTSALVGNPSCSRGIQEKTTPFVVSIQFLKTNDVPESTATGGIVVMDNYINLYITPSTT